MSNTGEYVPPIGGYRWTDNFAKLVCSRCKKYLSIGPILSSADGTVNICGRCDQEAVEDHGEFYRNFLYESMAQFLLFPSNSGCTCKSLWNSVTIHDRDCPARRIDCFDPICPAFVRFEDVLDHFLRMHRVYQGPVFTFYLSGSKGIRLIAFDAYLFVFSFVVHRSTIWFNILNVNYVNKQTLRFRFNTLNYPMHPDDVNNRYRIGLWSEFKNVLLIEHMYQLSIPESSPSKSDNSVYVIELIIEGLELEDAAVCPECFRKMVEENCCMCIRGHTYCLECYQEAEFCPHCTEWKMKSLRRNWILEDDSANWD